MESRTSRKYNLTFTCEAGSRSKGKAKFRKRLLRDDRLMQIPVLTSARVLCPAKYAQNIFDNVISFNAVQDQALSSSSRNTQKKKVIGEIGDENKERKRLAQS